MTNVRIATICACLLGMAAALPALGAFSATDVFLPSVGAGAGAGTSVWYTTVWVHNPGTAPVDVQFTFLLRDQANVGSPWVYNDRIQPGDTARYPNVLETLFGITSRMFGAIRVQASERIIVNGRIYSQEQGEEERDSTGQFFAGVPASFAVGAGQTTRVLGVSQTSPQSSSEYRYNYGFVEAAGGDVLLDVAVLDGTGTRLMTKGYALRPFEPKQFNLTDILPTPALTNSVVEVNVRSNSTGKVVVFGSGIANRSNDPSTFEMSFSDSLLADSGGGGAFTLPYQGSAAVVGSAFKVSNSGSGGSAVHGVSGGGVTGYGVLGQADEGSGVRGEVGPGLGVEGLAITGDGVRGLSASGKGVSGYTDRGGAGVHGVGGAASGKPVLGSVGVWGDSAASPGVWGTSNSAAGVLGFSGTNVGVGGVSDSGDGVKGSSSTGNGVAGYAGANGAGVYGESAGTAVSGFSNATSGYNYGVRGRTASTEGAGVAGFNVATDGFAYGVFGRSDARFGRAVYGVNNYQGVWGALGSGGYAFEGMTSNNSWVGIGSNQHAGYMYHKPSDNTVYLATENMGVIAYGVAPGATGVYASSHDHLGVWGTTSGEAWDRAGVLGDTGSSTTTLATGVWGSTRSPSGYGGRFESRTRDGIGVALWTGATQGYLIKGYWIDQTGAEQGLVFKVDSGGRVFADHSYNCGSASACFNTGAGADLAERIDASEDLTAGDVVEIDPGNPGHFRLARTPLSTMVAGVISSQPAMTMNNNDLESNDSGERRDTRPLLALVGQVPVKASAENGTIAVGDLLVSSSTAGHAMRCTAALLCSGAVIGKALDSLEEGRGVITMLVSAR